MAQFFWSIVAGLIIGVIAKLLIPGRQDIPLWLTVILGMVGAIIGNWIAAAFGVNETRGFDWWRHIFQVAAAAILIALIAPVWARRRMQHGRPSAPPA